VIPVLRELEVTFRWPAIRPAIPVHRVVSNFIIYHVVDGVRKLARSNTMATSTQLKELAALAKRIEDFVSAIERPMNRGPGCAVGRVSGAVSRRKCASGRRHRGGRLVLQLNGDADVPLFAATTSASSCARLAPMSALMSFTPSGHSPSRRAVEKGSATRVSFAQRVGPAS
jgi:hypothetical protein